MPVACPPNANAAAIRRFRKGADPLPAVAALGGDGARAAAASVAASLRTAVTGLAKALVAFGPELAAALLAIALYAPAAGYGFVFDDLALLSEDGQPLALGGSVPYRPLRYASYLLDHWLGASPAIYHAHNVALHGLVTALVVLLARLLGSRPAAAFAAGALVAVHPLSVETVAYVAGRRDLLCVALGLGALVAHRRAKPVASAALVVLSAAAKESGLFFVAPLVAMSWAGLDGPVSPRRDMRFGVVMAGAGGLVLALAYGAIGPWAPSPDAAGLALPGRVAAHYLAGLFLMHELGPEYPALAGFAASVRAGDFVAAAAGGAGTMAVAGAALASMRMCRRAGRHGRGRETAFVLAWMSAALVALSVWGGLHEPGVDRHASLLLPPIAIAVSLWLTRLTPRTPLTQLTPLTRRASRNTFSQSRSAAVACGSSPSPRAAVAVVAVVVTLGTLATLATLAWESRTQMEIWRSDASLWRHAASASAPSARARANVARVLAAGGAYKDATRHLNLGLAAWPDDRDLLFGRAVVHCAAGHRPRARRDLELARRRGTPDAEVLGLADECGLRGFRLAPRVARIKPGLSRSKRASDALRAERMP